MIIGDKMRANKLQYDVNRVTTKMSASLSGKIDKQVKGIDEQWGKWRNVIEEQRQKKLVPSSENIKKMMMTMTFLLMI